MQEGLGFVAIESIEVVEDEQDVYDIEVDDVHCFFADGILVHNCLAGIFSYEMMRGWEEGLSESRVLANMEEYAGRFDEIFNQGMDPRFFLELQFNRVEIKDRMAQHELNELLVKLHRKTGIPLVAAADYHYPDKNLFRSRQIVKATNSKDSKLAESLEELDCHLYPKNGRQMIEEYNEMDGGDYLTQEELLTAIRNTRHIADELISIYDIDTAPKFPTMNFNPKKMLMQALADELNKLAKRRGFDPDTKKKYVRRVQEELELIDDKRFDPYFTTYKIIMDELRKQMLIGPGRGCFVPGTRVKMHDCLMADISTVEVGDHVIDAYGDEREVIDVFEYDVSEEIVELEFEDGVKIRCTADHKFLTSNRGWVEAKDLSEEDDVVTVRPEKDLVKIKSKRTIEYEGPVYDLCVEGSHTYNVECRAVHNSGAGSLINYLLGITDIDPIKHNLRFDRFLDPYRVETVPNMLVGFE